MTTYTSPWSAIALWYRSLGQCSSRGIVSARARKHQHMPLRPGRTFSPNKLPRYRPIDSTDRKLAVYSRNNGDLRLCNYTILQCRPGQNRMESILPIGPFHCSSVAYCPSNVYRVRRPLGIFPSRMSGPCMTFRFSNNHLLHMFAAYCHCNRAPPESIPYMPFRRTLSRRSFFPPIAPWLHKFRVSFDQCRIATRWEHIRQYTSPFLDHTSSPCKALRCPPIDDSHCSVVGRCFRNSASPQ